jgi:deoxyribodipyrimidine photolyase
MSTFAAAHALRAPLRKMQRGGGTGTDTRPNRGFNPAREAVRFAPTGDAHRRCFSDLASLPPKTIQQPRKVGTYDIAWLGYPAPLADRAEGRGAFVGSHVGDRTSAVVELDA